MSLLADGWHMNSHVLAIGLSAMTYTTVREGPALYLRTWKIKVLGGFVSAIFLLGVTVIMVIGSAEQIISPQSTQFQKAIMIAILGLVINVVCALILGKAHHHDHEHEHSLEHDPHHGHYHDLNLKSACLHVIADAATSVLAIIALVGGWIYGWSWLEPVMGIVGAVLVAIWAKRLIAETSKVLLDREMDHPVVDEIREVVEFGSEVGDTRLTDLHVWRVGKQVYTCGMTVVTHDAMLTPAVVRERLSVHEEIAHWTIEVHYCPDVLAQSVFA